MEKYQQNTRTTVQQVILMGYTADVGRKIVRLARRSIMDYLEMGRLTYPSDEDVPSEKMGVFVSLYTYPESDLRGCIGYPYPIMSLKEAVAKAAVAAATQDPRFNPVEVGEMDRIVVEVSVLTRPEEVKCDKRTDLPRNIRVGVDGLIIETPYGSGLLLPQVPVEYGWDSETYLTHLCLKAGLEPTYWLHGRMRLLRYTAQIFRETSPGGDVVEVSLGA